MQAIISERAVANWIQERGERRRAAIAAIKSLATAYDQEQRGLAAAVEAAKGELDKQAAVLREAQDRLGRAQAEKLAATFRFDRDKSAYEGVLRDTAPGCIGAFVGEMDLLAVQVQRDVSARTFGNQNRQRERLSAIHNAREAAQALVCQPLSDGQIEAELGALRLRVQAITKG